MSPITGTAVQRYSYKAITRCCQYCDETVVGSFL